MTIESGTRLGPYEIAEPIGEGGMGQVYRARDSRLGRAVAIKVIQPSLASDAERLARFEREARLASSLNHPNIVTIYDLSAADGTAFMAMELVAGQSLRDRMRVSPPALKEAVAIAVQVASGLAAAHRAGIVHRDLKPENVMITPQGSVKILDFGLAKLLVSEVPDQNAATAKHITVGPQVMGTAAYMSPEQTRGEELDFRTDQFSFGVMLYELLAGRHPFARPSLGETFAAISRDEPTPLSDVRPGIPEMLGWIVERCLEKSRERRYGSTDDLVADLTHLQQRGSATVAAPAPTRSKLPLALALTAAALVLFGVVGGILFAGREKQAASPPSYVALALPRITIIGHPVNSPVAISPDGRRILFVASAPDEQPRIWLRDLSSAATTHVEGTEHAYGPTWSPDGKQIAFFTNGKLNSVPAGGGSPQVLCDAFGGATMAWNADGTIVFAQLNPPDGPGLFKVDSRGGTAVRLTRLDARTGEFAHLWPEFLPDGKRYLFVRLRSSIAATASTIDLMVGSLDGTPMKRIGAITSHVLYRNGALFFVRDGKILSQAFDVDALRFSGEPSVVAEGVSYIRDSAAAAFAAATNGTVVYWTARANSRLLVVDSHGKVSADLGSARFNMGRLAGGADTRLAISVLDPNFGCSDIWMYDTAGRAPSRVTLETWDERAPVWSPDRRSFFYSLDIVGPPDIFRFDLDRNRREPVLMTPGRQDPLDVAPDGRTLLYEDFTRAHAFDLLTFSLKPGAKPEPLVTTEFDEEDGRFSPDGRSVSFTSDVSGRNEIYVTPFPARGTPIRVSSGGGAVARWSTDGHELTYLAPQGAMTAVSVVASGDSLQFGPARFLFRLSEGISTYEVDSAGRFVVVTNETDPPPPIQLVLR